MIDCYTLSGKKLCSYVLSSVVKGSKHKVDRRLSTPECLIPDKSYVNFDLLAILLVSDRSTAVRDGLQKYCASCYARTQNVAQPKLRSATLKEIISN